MSVTAVSAVTSVTSSTVISKSLDGINHTPAMGRHPGEFRFMSLSFHNLPPDEKHLISQKPIFTSFFILGFHHHWRTIAGT